MNIPHEFLVPLAALDNGRKPDIVPLKKYGEGVFSECCTESFKSRLLIYANEILFKGLKADLKDKYLRGLNPQI